MPISPGGNFDFSADLSALVDSASFDAPADHLLRPQSEPVDLPPRINEAPHRLERRFGRSITGWGPMAGRALPLAALIAVAACSHLPMGTGGGSNQLDAALDEIRSSERGQLVLERQVLSLPDSIPRPGTPFSSSRDGSHSQAWLDATVAAGLADDHCGQCSTDGATVITLSRPYRGGNAHFVDAEIRGIAETDFGRLRVHHIVQIQLERADGEWRALGRIPLWSG